MKMALGPSPLGVLRPGQSTPWFPLPHLYLLTPFARLESLTFPPSHTPVNCTCLLAGPRFLTSAPSEHTAASCLNTDLNLLS